MGSLPSDADETNAALDRFFSEVCRRMERGASTMYARALDYGEARERLLSLARARGCEKQFLKQSAVSAQASVRELAERRSMNLGVWIEAVVAESIQATGITIDEEHRRQLIDTLVGYMQGFVSVETGVRAGLTRLQAVEAVEPSCMGADQREALHRFVAGGGSVPAEELARLPSSAYMRSPEVAKHATPNNMARHLNERADADLLELGISPRSAEALSAFWVSIGNGRTMRRKLRSARKTGSHRSRRTSSGLDPLDRPDMRSAQVLQLESEPGEGSEERPDDRLSFREEVSAALALARSVLSERELQVWLACEIEGMTQEEAAEKLQVRRPTVQTYATRAKRKIAQLQE